jgi:hypothetical protein
MTHDELLAKTEMQGAHLQAGDNPYLDALRAVVELHKPFMYDGRMGKYERCEGCSSEEEWLGNIYPCPTIQAIEKELG